VTKSCSIAARLVRFGCKRRRERESRMHVVWQGLVEAKHDTPDRQHQLLVGVKTPRQLGTFAISNPRFGEHTLARPVEGSVTRASGTNDENLGEKLPRTSLPSK
jgi:hypothetical protein